MVHVDDVRIVLEISTKSFDKDRNGIWQDRLAQQGGVKASVGCCASGVAVENGTTTNSVQ
jgi:hypothetical protein